VLKSIQPTELNNVDYQEYKRRLYTTWEKERLVDEIDELFARAFVNSDVTDSSDDPLHCYLMLVVLLSYLGEFSPGMSTKAVREQVRDAVGNENFFALDDISQQIAQRVHQIIQSAPTYTAASYWSPIDRRRHTASHRRPVGVSEDEKKIWAFAYAFYALTFTGQDKNYFSATQYTAVRARTIRGVRVSYNDVPEENDPNLWWHLPRGSANCNHERILSETGLSESIELCLLREDVSKETLRQQLRAMLMNRQPGGWLDVNSFTSTFFERFARMVSSTSKATRADARKTKTYLNNLLDAAERVNDFETTGRSNLV